MEGALFICSVFVLLASTGAAADEVVSAEPPIVPSLVSVDNTDLSNVVENANPTELGKKVAELKKQALKIMSLRGMENLDLNADIKPSEIWDDVRITEDVYQDLKNSFEEEEKRLNSTEEERAAAPDFKLMPDAKWPMPIQYTTKHITNPVMKNDARKAIQEIEKNVACISFVEASSTPQTSYIQFKQVTKLSSNACGNSLIGRQPNVNVVNIACQGMGVILHEILHSLGFGHTHQRPDADQFIAIHAENLETEQQSNFKSWRQALRNQGEFDYGSIMMYSTKAFTKNEKETLIPKRNATKNRQLMGQRKRLSTGDIDILNKIYCGSQPSPGNKKCADRFRSCGYWQKRGYCDESSMYHTSTVERCPASCKIC